MDYMDPDVCCPQKGCQTLSLTHSPCQNDEAVADDYWFPKPVLMWHAWPLGFVFAHIFDMDLHINRLV